MSAELLDQPIPAIAAALRETPGRLHALMDEVIARHGGFESSLNAYQYWDADRLRTEAEAVSRLLAAGVDLGPLMGLPVSIKDIYGVAGMPTHAGGPTPLAGSWQAEGPVVRTLRRGLAIVPGKTHTVEMAFGAVGTNAHWPDPRNPWDASAHRVCGGSSSGAGVSLAMGTALVAMGSDTGGSVRIPASVTGQVGLKVSIHRWSVDGIVPLSSTFDTPGPLTRNVTDAVLAFGAIDPGHDDPMALLTSLSGLDLGEVKFGIGEAHFWNDCEPGIVDALQQALSELQQAGARSVDLPLPEAGEARKRFIRAGLFGVEGLSFLREFYPERWETLDPNVKARFELAERVSGLDYFSECRKVHELARRVDGKLGGVDVLVTPTVPITPPTVDAVGDPAAYVRAGGLMTRNTQPINLLELCAITLPVGLDAAGMPVGLQLVGRHGEDERLLAVALACEKVLGTGRERLGVAPLCR